MGKGPLRDADPEGQAIRKITVWESGAEADVSASPTITSGDGVPSAAEVDGSIYLRTGGNGVLYVRVSGAWLTVTAS
jgi:hypothetical protein